MPTITIIDESTLGSQRAWSLDVLDETMSLRELIRRRIYQEVTEYNAHCSSLFHGLVQPTHAERSLNGHRLKTFHALDWQTQFEKVVIAFTQRGYIVLVDQRQITNLDASIELHRGAEITFLKLVPLIGG